MSPSLTKAVGLATGVLGLIAVFYFALHRPATFGNAKYLGAILMLEVVLVALGHYEKVFFPLVMLCFLWAGTGVPLAAVGGTVRWVVLAAAAGYGLVMWMRGQQHTFTAFDFVALCCVAAAVASSVVSNAPKTSLLKALSLFLLFLYGATGARLAVLGREVKFAKGLVLACEGIVYVTAIAYLVVGLQFFGNPNSLGAVMAVAATPILSWGVLIAETRGEKYRRAAALVLTGILLYDSLSRASMLAGTVAVIVLCTMLRRQRLLLQGAIVVALLMTCSALINPSHFDEFFQSVTSNVLYKGKEKGGVLGSRRSPWQDTVAAIKEHPLFGTGFGTSYMGEFGQADRYDLAAAPRVRTKVGSNREHGNSYLALTEYMGLLGIIPFAVMLLFLSRMILRVCVWMHATANPHHCAVPFAMVLLAGMVHAFFEDWLIAVGYYLCVFFWTSAFLLQDMISARSYANVFARAQFQTVETYGTAAPNR